MTNSRSNSRTPKRPLTLVSDPTAKARTGRRTLAVGRVDADCPECADFRTVVIRVGGEPRRVHCHCSLRASLAS
jgi:hypothetical protein